ncbi:MAG: signal peptidase II [Thermoleophilaceae bacterium]|nr:signal peptidase II [Thermoleophilaceae bacterium]
MSARARHWLLALAATAVVLGVDQATKALVRASLAIGEARDLFPGLDLAYVRNRGVAFGFFGGGGVAVSVLTTVALAALVVYFALRSATRLLWLPTGLVLGGALGNVWDRARDGAVTDFIDPAAWPAFNVADVCIVVGVLALLWLIEAREAR